ncbi:MAG: T9SS type A sorting domain-containing protein [Bacteroidetes bacterium]|nr:T9SS type A sorting domain-containing protein [Bacteroidota bacterium]
MNRLLLLCAVLLTAISAHASNSPAYEQRRTDYIDTSLAHFDTDALPIQAYRGLPLDTAGLHYILDHIRTDGDADFRIVQMVRVLFLTQATHQYDSVILASVNSVKYWINYGDSIHVYWSENHMAMWMGSDYLLQQSYGRPVDTLVRSRVLHYLQLKNQYGFYEFNSSVYLPYCLSGILNLADFATDPQIKALATSAAQKLMSDYLLRMTNDKGTFFPTAGRNYYGKYETPYGQNHNNLIWLLTGMGPMPDNASHCGAFLATSDIPVDTVSNSWRPTLDTVFQNGHSLAASFAINEGQDTIARIIFRWSGGGYFMPSVVLGSGAMIADSGLWNNYTFQSFRQLSGLPLSLYPQLSQSLNVISYSSLIMDARLAEYKHNSVTLSSTQDFFKGKVGFQQWPCVANVGTTAVYTASGPVYANWEDHSEDNANYHLPYVEQHHNVALLMYRPQPVPDLIPYHNTDVALHWNVADFDQSVNDSLWFVGRQGSSYAAARMYCIGQIDSQAACHYTTDGSAYVIVVGDSTLYGSFQNFQTLVHNSRFSDSRYYDSVNHLSVYQAQITFDTISISYAWGIDSTAPNGIRDLSAPAALHVYPNPATDQVTVTLADHAATATLQVTDLMGRVVYSYDGTLQTGTALHIDTKAWPQGMYILTGDSPQGRYTQKLVKE